MQWTKFRWVRREETLIAWRASNFLLLADTLYFLTGEEVPWMFSEVVHSVFGIKASNLVHIESMKNAFNLFLSFVESTTSCSTEDWSVKGKKAFVSAERSMLQTCNT